MTLAEFLLARIAEDEADAKRIEQRRLDWLARRGPVSSMTWHITDENGSISGKPPSPQRWLAECDAKRSIVELHRPDPKPDYDNGCGTVHDQNGRFLGYRTDLCEADGERLPCQTRSGCSRCPTPITRITATSGGRLELEPERQALREPHPGLAARVDRDPPRDPVRRAHPGLRQVQPGRRSRPDPPAELQPGHSAGRDAAYASTASRLNG